MPGTELTGDGAAGTATGQNALCALADCVEKKVALKASPSANVAQMPLARQIIVIHAAQQKN